MQQNPPRGGFGLVEDAKIALAIIAYTSQIIAAPVEPILRRRFGTRYFGMWAVYGCFVPLLWPGLWPEYDPRPMYWFWGLYIVMQIWSRIGTFRAISRGFVIHSRYNGEPRLAFFLRRKGEVEIKGRYEPALVMMCGLFAFAISVPLGVYLIAAAMALAINHSIIEAAERARTQDISDAFIEQQQMAERFRHMHGR